MAKFGLLNIFGLGNPTSSFVVLKIFGAKIRLDENIKMREPQVQKSNNLKIKDGGVGLGGAWAGLPFGLFETGCQK